MRKKKISYGKMYKKGQKLAGKSKWKWKGDGMV